MDTIHETGEIRHEALNDLGDRILDNGHAALLFAFLAILATIMTIAVVVDAVRRRRDRKARELDEAEAQRRRQRGIDEGFRQGWHG